MDALEKVKPVIERALVRMGQSPKTLSAEEAARFARPFDVTPQVHYLLEIAGQEAALSIYYLGNDDARTMEILPQLAKASSAERESGLPVGFHLQTFNKMGFFVHLTTGPGGRDSGLQNFLLQLFSHKTTGLELGKALSS
jgi:hypothetical protein